MRIAYIDCFSGASGDMLVGALLDAGWAVAELEAILAQLGAADYRIAVKPVTKQGVAATQVTFELPEQPVHRRFGVLLDMLARSALSDAIKTTALGVLRRLGEAEAKVHGTAAPLEALELHELGSLDTLFDVVATVAGLAALGPSAVHVSPINLGGGFVQTAHGLLPVPGPAVAALVQGLPVFGGDRTEGELLTPTGAALISALGSRFGPLPAMTVERVGYGAGRKEGRLPNVVRLWLGESDLPATADRVQLLEANIDDMNPELYGYLIDRLLAAGALDVYLTPVIMKKTRPGTVLSVLCPPEQAETLGELIFVETTTLGIRSSVLARRKLERDSVVVDTAFGPLRVKVGRRGDRVLTIAPEFDDCRRVAEERGLPLRAIYDAVRRAFDQVQEGSVDG